MELKTGDIFIWSQVGFIATPIQWWAGKGSHAATALVFRGMGFIIESNQKGVILTPAKTRLQKGNWMSRRPKHEFDSEELIDMALRLLGHKYDFASLLFYQPIFILSKGKYLQNSDNYANRYYCSELVARLAKLQNWHTVTPNDLIGHKDYVTLQDWKNG